MGEIYGRVIKKLAGGRVGAKFVLMAGVGVWGRGSTILFICTFKK